MQKVICLLSNLKSVESPFSNVTAVFKLQPQILLIHFIESDDATQCNAPFFTNKNIISNARKSLRGSVWWIILLSLQESIYFKQGRQIQGWTI